MGKSLYFLVYLNNGKRSELSLRTPTIDSRDFIRVRGVRATKLFNSITSVLDAYSLKYGVSKDNGRVIVELPADVGYAVLVYMLLAYGTNKPDRYLFFLEKLLAGMIPLTNYLITFVNIAVDLSDLKSDGRHKKATVDHNSAKIVSQMMRTLFEYIEKM